MTASNNPTSRFPVLSMFSPRPVLVPMLAATALLLAYAEPSLAVINCNSTITYSANMIATDDYERTVSSAVPCIQLTGGADFNLAGRKITCKGSWIGACGTAIKATATGSIVNNTTPANIAITSDIGTGWDTAVQEAQQVLSLRIHRAFTGISNYTIPATKIDGNVITNVVVGIDSLLNGATSLISNNLVSTDLPDNGLAYDTDRHGISAVGQTSGSGSKVQNNMVINSTWGIYGQNILRINDNVVCNDHPYGGNGDGVMIQAPQTGSHNLCCNAASSPINDACMVPTATPAPFYF